MAIKITIGSKEDAEQAAAEKAPAIQATKSLDARRTLDGNIAIFDHRDIDIVLMPKKKKIVAFAKDSFGEHVYGAIDGLFKYLTKKGVVSPESVQGGNIYSSIEGKIADSQEFNVVQVALFSIAKYIEQERPYFDYQDYLDDKEEERLTNPNDEDSTEFDPERHETQKGTLRPGIRPYGISSVYTL